MSEATFESAGARSPEELEREPLIEAVRARERFLEGILGSLESFVTIDRDWRFTFVNAAAARMTGRSPEELLGTDIRQLDGEGVREQFAAPLSQAMSRRVTVEFDVADPREKRLYRGMAYPLADGGLALYVRDVTEQARAEEARAEAEERLRLAVAAAGFAAFDYYPATGELVWDERLRRLWGVRPGEELDYEQAFERVHPDDRERVRQAIAAASDPRGGGDYEFEFRVVWPDGSVHWRRTSGRVYFAEGADGELRPVRRAGIEADISERKQADAALRESEQLLRTVLDHSRDGVNMLDLKSGKYVFMNAAQVALTGFTTEELNGIAAEEAYERVHPDDRAISVEQQQRVAAGEDLDEPVEYRWRVKSGDYRWFSDRRKVVRDEDGTPVALVGISRDITEQKRTEQALRESDAEKAAQRERIRLARELHDSVTQALFAATIKAEALTLDESLPAETTAAAEEVRRLTRGALAQMRTLLLELRADPLDEIPIPQLLRHLAEAAESRARIRVRISVHGEAMLPPALNEPIYRIVQEALNNVARHARAADAWVTLEVARTGVHLVVGDDGKGFDPDLVDPSHHGVRSMRERAAEAGAELKLATSPGRGTEVIVDWAVSAG